jgi:hypothetical protein
MKKNHKYRLQIALLFILLAVLIILLFKPFSNTFYSPFTKRASYLRPTAISLSLVNIQNVEEATARLNNIAEYIKKEGPRLIVHLVNWYRYDPKDMSKTMGWSGTGKDKIALTSKPLFGYYSCDNPLYIDWVLSFSNALGVDELNIDYEGGIDTPEEYKAYYHDRSWDNWFMELLNRAEKNNMKISVMYEPKSILGRLASRKGKGGPIQTSDSTYHREALQLLKSDLKKICDKFTIKKNENGRLILNPVYTRIAGLPVIWVFGMTAGSLTEGIWKQAIDELHSEGYAFVLVANNYNVNQAGFDRIVQGMNPWLDQLFTGFQSQYRGLWDAAQKAAGKGDRDEAKRIANQYIDEIASNGLNVAAPVRKVNGSGNFNITPLAIGFQDADVNGWGLRPPVYIEPYDRSCTEPGKLFRAYFAAAQKSNNLWYLICSGDDLAERTNVLIPDEEYGFSGPYAIAMTSALLGKNPNIQQAIQITEDFIRQQNNGLIPENIQQIIKEANEILPDQLKREISTFIQKN